MMNHGLDESFFACVLLPFRQTMNIGALLYFQSDNIGMLHRCLSYAIEQIWNAAQTNHRHETHDNSIYWYFNNLVGRGSMV